MSENHEERKQEMQETRRIRSGWLTLRLCIAALLLAAAVVVRAEAGPQVQDAVAGVVEEDCSLVAVFSDIGRWIVGHADTAET
ncbi:MAG: hypothetical protein IJC53_01365 [Clostridia bacterium]|nr:hypothetical protein [Clostridia bacterium]